MLSAAHSTEEKAEAIARPKPSQDSVQVSSDSSLYSQYQGRESSGLCPSGGHSFPGFHPCSKVSEGLTSAGGVVTETVLDSVPSELMVQWRQIGSLPHGVVRVGMAEPRLLTWESGRAS